MKMKKLVAVLLALSLLAVLAACSSGDSAEETMKKARENMQQLSSMSYSMTMYMDISFEDEHLSTVSDVTADYIAEPMAMRMNMTMDMGEMGQAEYVSYAMAQDGDYVVYTGMEYGGETFWMKQTLEDMEALEQYNAQSNMDLYISSAENFKKGGEETINGSAATRYDGVITKQALEEVMDSAGMADYLSGADMEEAAGMLQNMDDLYISIWVDNESLLPVQYEMDMTAMLQSMFSALADQAGGGTAPVMERVSVIMTVTGFDNVDSIELPPEALEAVEY